MNTLKARVITTAAAIALAAVASAQELKVKATVPFPFTAGAAGVMPAGTYEIPATAGAVWSISNRETGASHFIAGNKAESKANDEAKLVFECRGDRCALREIRVGHGSVGYELPAPKRSKSDSEELARVVVIPAALAN